MRGDVGACTCGLCRKAGEGRGTRAVVHAMAVAGRLFGVPEVEHGAGTCVARCVRGGGGQVDERTQHISAVRDRELPEEG